MERREARELNLTPSGTCGDEEDHGFDDEPQRLLKT